MPTLPALAGGAYACVLGNCVLSNNYNSSIEAGGAAAYSILNHCLLTANANIAASYSTLNYCNVTGNIGGGVLASTLNYCSVTGNAAGAGAGAESGCALTGCLLAGNNATYQGGGAESCSLTNCVLVGNTAGYYGGGGFNCTLVNCTILSNAVTLSPNGGGACNCTLENCIAYYNTFIMAGASPVTNNYTGGTLAYCCTYPAPATGAGNITNEPTFVNLSSGNLRPLTGSPVIDAGLNTYAVIGTDFDGRPRIVNSRVDIGASEFQGPGTGEFIAWLGQYGLPTDGSADYTDSDRDGMNNWQEWIAGTDPTDAASALRMLRPTTIGSSKLPLLTWQSVSNRTYFLDRGTNLAVPASFISLQTNILGQAGTTEFTDITATNQGPYFYRVGIW